jgi:hypothetical protein
MERLATVVSFACPLGKNFMSPYRSDVPTHRSIEDTEHGGNVNGIQAPLSESDKAVQEAINLEKRVTDAAQPSNQEKKNEEPRVTY